MELGLLQVEVSPVVPTAAIYPWLIPEAKVNLTLQEKRNKEGIILDSEIVRTYITSQY